MPKIIGTCGNCGGPVGFSDGWMSTEPEKPKCRSCGSIPKNVFGPTIEMDPKPAPYDNKAMSITQKLLNPKDGDSPGTKAAIESLRKERDIPVGLLFKRMS